jgi:tetratricopeptide (TPR) repeat protein
MNSKRNLTFSVFDFQFSIPLARLLIGMLLASCLSIRAATVKVWEQDAAIPTYLAGPPDPNPMFYFGRASQGAEGRVYPYPLYDSLTNIRSNKTYHLVYLENEYVRIGILPEIGGRLFEAVDKSNNYDFIYRQHVIKPALIGLIGAWISGGIEWNIPHHHRATTFLPVQHRVEEGSDGGKTVWVGELELRDRMRWAVGYTLRPGRSYLECSVRIINRTPFANSMLCFANVAVHVNNNYQVIYPPRTQFVTFHSKREFTTWPITTAVFNGADFTRGVDVSWYSNHFSANSMFAWNYEDDFFAGYDHGRRAGIISVADHHVVPGKKFWTWGNGPRGRMWDKILTDTDGPYIELMVGAYSDNQPDYSWLQPYESRSVKMYWYPFRNIEGVKEANLEGAVNLEIATNGAANVGFCTTSAHRLAQVSLKAGSKILLEETISINPGKPFARQVPLPAGVDAHALRASLTVGGKELVAYSPVKLQPASMPDPIGRPAAPKDIQTVEELYLAAQRLEQFHDPNLQPEPYWEEALRRDPADARVNTALGVRQLKRARWAEAEQHFRKALRRITANYTTPKNAEPFYFLGLTLEAQDKMSEAADAFSKAAWDQAWKGPAFFSLAEIATRRGDFLAALDFLDRSLAANALNVRALTLKAATLRHTGQTRAVLGVVEAAAERTDPLDVRLMNERRLAGSKRDDKPLLEALRDAPATGLETAVEYANAGLWREAIDLLELMIGCSPNKGKRQPLTYYYLACFSEQLGKTSKAAEYRRLAAEAEPDCVFPFQWEAIRVLRRAMELNPSDARAPYYLGNLLFDWQPEEAAQLWKQSVTLDPSFPIAHRNLALAYAHQKPTNDLVQAIAQLEQAVACAAKYPRQFAELDELYAAAGTAPEKRNALLEKNHSIVSHQDDALSREIGLKVFAGKYDEAIALMTGRKFSVWEGGSLDVADHWVNAHLLRGQSEMASGQFAAALADFEAAATVPANLPTERRENEAKAQIAYWMGLAYEALGDPSKARQSWQGAADKSAPNRIRRSDGRPTERQAQIYYEALAKRKAGQNEEAEAALRGLLETARRALAGGDEEGDSGEASPRRLPPAARMALAHYLAGMANLGLGDQAEARKELTAALQARPDHLGAKAALDALSRSPEQLSK